MIRGWIESNGGEKITIPISEPYGFMYFLTIANNGKVAYSEIRHHPYSHFDYIWYRPANEYETNLAKRLDLEVN